MDVLYVSKLPDQGQGLEIMHGSGMYCRVPPPHVILPDNLNNEDHSKTEKSKKVKQPQNWGQP